MKYSLRLPLLALLMALIAPPALAQDSVTVDLPDFSGEVGETVLIPIDLTEILPEAPEVIAFDGTITYDPAVFEFTEEAVKLGTLSESLAGVDVNITASGEITIAGYGSDPIARGPGVLVYLEATLVAEGTSPLTFEEFIFNEGDPASATTGGSLSVASSEPPPPPSNQPPEVVAPLDDQSLIKGESIELDLSGVFSDPDGDALTFSASSDDPSATAEVEGSTLTVTAADIGEAEITVTAGDGNGGEISDTFSTSVAGGSDVEETLPDEFSLSSAYPNPFTKSTQLTLTTPAPQHVRVDVYNALGRRVQVLYDGRIAGKKLLEFDAERLASGIYVIKITGETFEATRQVALVQ